LNKFSVNSASDEIYGRQNTRIAPLCSWIPPLDMIQFLKSLHRTISRVRFNSPKPHGFSNLEALSLSPSNGFGIQLDNRNGWEDSGLHIPHCRFI
jgi:hypothetical protein